jgi:hypothetical protein
MGPESCELGPDLCLNMGPAIRDWVPLIPSDSYLEMGGVWLGGVLINTQIAAGLRAYFAVTRLSQWFRESKSPRPGGSIPSEGLSFLGGLDRVFYQNL